MLAQARDLDWTVWRYRPGQAMARHDHDRGSLSIVLAGDVLESSGGDEEHGRAGSLVVKPAGAPHANLFGPWGAVMMSIKPGPEWDQALKGSAWRWRHGGHALGFRLARALSQGDGEGWAEEVLAGVAATDAPDTGRSTGGSGRRAERVRDRIEAALPARPSVIALAAAEGVHPVYLTRCFRARFGASISAYVRQARVRRAAERLVRGEPTVQAALGEGFADQSHLTRAFTGEFGAPPAAFRRLHAGLLALAQDSPD